MNLRVEKLFMILNKMCVLFLTARTLHSSDRKSNYNNDSNNITEIFVSLQVHVNVFNRPPWLEASKRRSHHSKMNHNSSDQNKSKAQSMMTNTSEGKEGDTILR